MRNGTIPDMTHQKCFRYGTQGMCEDGALLFLDPNDYCNTLGWFQILDYMNQPTSQPWSLYQSFRGLRLMDIKTLSSSGGSRWLWVGCISVQCYCYNLLVHITILLKVFQCVPQTVDGQRCPSNETSYNNSCHILYEELGLDKRLEADIFGNNVGYRCKREDYVTWSDGTCYPLLSPSAVCSPGQQIRWSVWPHLSYSIYIIYLQQRSLAADKKPAHKSDKSFVQQIKQILTFWKKKFNFQVFNFPNRGRVL